MTLILASTSPYRRALLTRLGVEFTCVAPHVDETPEPNETPEQLAARLARAKAAAVATDHPEAIVIGSDQVAALSGQVMNKPGTHDRATAQLKACSGEEVHFYTGVTVAAPDWQEPRTRVVPFTVHFKPLDEGLIERYLQREQPYDCAGSFKVEALGIALFERLAGDDPTSLEGLPLIATVELLEQAGMEII